MNAIQVDDVRKSYGRGAKAVEALQGVSLEVSEGTIFGLLGRNGAGKTTLIKILLDIVRPTQGQTSLLGVSSRSSAARDQVGYLPEDHRFPEYRTAEGAMRFYAALSGVDSAAVDERVPQLLEQVDLGGERSKRKVRSFSKGMKQRLGLAQALVSDPKILFLDEPTDGVDPVGRARVRDLLLELKAEGRTIFLNSHLLGEVETVCDRVAILEQGTIVQSGTIDELTTSELAYTVGTAAPPSAALVEAIRGFAVSVDTAKDGSLEIKLTKEAHVDRLVDTIRESGAGLRHLTGKRVSLEDVFLAAVEHDEADDYEDGYEDGYDDEEDVT